MKVKIRFSRPSAGGGGGRGGGGGGGAGGARGLAVISYKMPGRGPISLQSTSKTTVLPKYTGKHFIIPALGFYGGF